MKKYVLLLILCAAQTPSIAQEAGTVAAENFRKAIKAAGGEARFKTIQAPTMWMETGTYHGMGDAIPFVAQYASYWPRRWYRQLIEGQFAVGVAGDQVTKFMGGANDGQKLSGEIRKAALHQARVGWAQLLYPLMDDDYTLSTMPGVEVAGKPTIGIKAVHESGGEIIMYFDKKTFLLAKSTATVFAKDKGELVKSETLYSDHKSFGGAKLPSKYKILYDGKLFAEGETTAIKVHATIDPAWFGTEGPARVR